MNGPNNAIGWCDYTWTPITGCARDCWYCYVKRIKGYNRTPQFHPDRLQEPVKLKKPAKIFICSTADIFGAWVMDTWIKQVLDIIKFCPQHQFLLLTKNPERISNFPEALHQSNLWLGVTIEQQQYLPRLKTLQVLAHQYNLPRLFISFEPLFSRIDITPEQLEGIKWIIIGAYTGKDAKLLRPNQSWVEDLGEIAMLAGIALFLKDNLKIYWQHLKQEFPIGGLYEQEKR